MTPAYLNPASSSFPFVDLREEQNLQLFLSPHQAATSLSGPTNFFNASAHDHQRETKPGESRQHDNQEVDMYNISHGGSSSSFQPEVNDHNYNSNFRNLSSSKMEDGAEESGESSVKWMPSKMRLMQKMTNSNCSETDHKPMKFMLKFHNQQYQNNEINSSSNSNSNIRVCSDCNTTSTPLWRSGPRGPKSLCNACGIRQRKARRAMAAAAAAANGTVIAIEASSSTRSSKVNNKVKKSRTSHVSQNKKLSKPPESSLQSQKKLCFKNLALSLSKNPALQQVLPHDVEEAAILLMELSCGFIHS
ncbi:PREDICTED: putative GATA transcription factor 22 [Populus euphratica]|uniref:GATA transcription factor 22 n=1 Tax=Populus euphratica TaxID=75702 RepID=A0AAJ6TYF1_POPEU|nr:PREDICTED: putative GATA transcription factor 22 [Populus euphratica]